nr:hypothetical protein [Mesorhizobium sp.]
MPPPVETIETLREQLAAKNKRILNLESKVADLRDELAEADLWGGGLSSGATAALVRVHRYICEGDVEEAVREMQSAFPELALRDRSTERRLIGLPL